MVTNDANWIVTQLQDGGMLEKAPHRIEVLNTISTLVKQGKYTHDRLVSSVALGFWTYLFTKVPFRIGGKIYCKYFLTKQLDLVKRLSIKN